MAAKVDVPGIGGRKEIRIRAEDGRDRGKMFLIREWDAARAERWALRVLFGLGKGGVELPPEILQLGAMGIFYAAGSQALRIPSRLALRLADELMECVERVETKTVRALVPEDIEEVSTRIKLKKEVLKLTYGFFVPAAPQTSATESGPKTP
jgi:hypothetical protein